MYRSLVVSTLLLSTFWYSALALSTPRFEHDPESVLEAEKMRFRAMVERDFSALDQVIHEDLVYVHSNGSTDTKASFIGAIETGTRSYDNITIEDPKVRVYGDVGILNATCTYHRKAEDGTSNNLSLYYTSVYAWLDGRWQHVSWQSFRLSQ